MYCKNCGAKLKEGNKFCTVCGAPAHQKAEDHKKESVVAEEKTTSSVSALKASFDNVDTASKRSFPLWKLIPWLIVILILGGLAYLIFSTGNSTDSSQEASTTPNNSQAVVDIVCDNGFGGSGTIFTTTGTILTNNHVITGATSCKVTIPNPATGQISEIYEAAPVIVPVLSKKYDVATVQIDASYTDSNGKTWGAYPTTFTPFTLPSTCSTSTASQLGDSIRIYGYPVTSGGYNLTETDGIISSFADDGDILTSAKVDSGNSGGLAIDQNGCYLGIPSAVISGNYQNLGVIIPGNIVEQFIPNIPVKADLVTQTTGSQDEAAQADITPQVAAPVTTPSTPNAPTETPEEQCEATYGTNSQYIGNDSNGEALCNCQSGYAWSGDGNSCEAKSDLLAYCQATYGAGSISEVSGGKSECDCGSGYEWNSDDTACVAPTPTCTDNATYDSSTGECECDSGYEPDGSICETDTEYCQNKDGYGAIYQASDDSCECEQGYTLNNGQCEDDYTYCSEEYSGETYDSATNACTSNSY